MLAVYEEKIKEGQLVRKVRLVADGRQHTQHGSTYSPTPSKEEFFILLHVFAVKDWTYFHVDEVRAFLNANKQDERNVFCKFSGNPEIFRVAKAVYGQKDAMRDYHDTVNERMVDILKYKKLQMCPCIYKKKEDSDVTLVYDFVDDFIFGGSNIKATQANIEEFQKITNSTAAEKDKEHLLGMEITRDYDKHIIMIRVQSKINDLINRFPAATRKRRNVPMPTSGYVVRDHEIEALSPAKRRVLETLEIEEYMTIIGIFIWVQGVRLDIIFAVLYLTWFTHRPLQHHLDMAYYVIGYLASTKDMPLVLGGESKIQTNVYLDASHGTAPKSKSITGSATKLNADSGAISAKSSAQTTVKLSSFESELDGVTTGFKTVKRVNNILDEIGIDREPVSRLVNDNESMINFVKGEGVAKGVRHMELRMFYTREEYAKGDVDFEHEFGAYIVSDKLTKLAVVSEFRIFATNIMGLGLLSYDYWADK
jgi:hypothetical protein